MSLRAEEQRETIRQLEELRRGVPSFTREELDDVSVALGARLDRRISAMAEHSAAPLADLDPTLVHESLLQEHLMAVSWEWRAAAVRVTAEMVRTKRAVDARLRGLR